MPELSGIMAIDAQICIVLSQDEILYDICAVGTNFGYTQWKRIRGFFAVKQLMYFRWFVQVDFQAFRLCARNIKQALFKCFLVKCSSVGLVEVPSSTFADLDCCGHRIQCNI